MKIYDLTQRWVWLCAAFLLAGTGCNQLPRAVDGPILNITQAYQTVEARLTDGIASTLTATLTPSPTIENSGETPTPVPPTATPSPTATRTATTPTATVICDQAAPGFPIDVTIPDDTPMEPGHTFTKTWRLQNAGSCTWDQNYALVWFSGAQLDAPLSVPLRGLVRPSETVDLSVDMTAPETPGPYQSNWKLRNASGALFGIGPSADSSFWVRVVVIEPATDTPQPELPATPTPSPTATISIRVNAPVSLQPADLLDLDTGEVNPDNGADIELVLGNQNHLLQPVGSASMAVYGDSAPSLSACQSAALSADPQVVEELLAGTYLCYRTNMALPGWARVVSFAPDLGILELEINTWAIP